MNFDTFPIEITTFDTTLRDGAQAQDEAHQFLPENKPGVADAIASLGVGTIEAGFPATPDDGEAVEAVASTVGNSTYTVIPRRITDGRLDAGVPYEFTPTITGLARAHPRDIDATWQAVQAARHPGIHTFIATAPNHIAAKFPGKTPHDVADMATGAVRHARDVGGPDTVVEFSSEAASTTDFDYLERVVKDVIQAGADIVNLPDTVGYATPKQIRLLFRNAAKWLIDEGVQDRVTLSAHNHNDLGRATDNTIAAAHAVASAGRTYGVKPPRFQAETVIGPFGERAGNTQFEQFVAGVLTHPDEFLDNGAWPDIQVDTTRIVPVARFIFDTVRMEIPPKAPVIGADINAHRSGIHADGVLKGGASVYASFDPRWFGHESSANIQPGAYQGRRGMQHLGAVDIY